MKKKYSFIMYKTYHVTISTSKLIIFITVSVKLDKLMVHNKKLPGSPNYV